MTIGFRLLSACLIAALLGCGSTSGDTDTQSDGWFNPWVDTRNEDLPQRDDIDLSFVDQASDVVACVPGSTMCLSLTAQAYCSEQGDVWVPDDCDVGTACENKLCRPVICTPGEQQGACVDSASFGVCSPGGTGWDPEMCPEGETCYQGSCVNYKCPPGAIVCLGMTAVNECQPKEDGSYDWVTVEYCDGGICQEGKCLNACEVNIKDNSYLGCSYWALDLENYGDGGLELVAVVVSAPVDGNDVNVTFTDWSTEPPTPLTANDLQVDNMMVPKGTLKIFMLPSGHDIPATSLTKYSFKIETDSPVTVHQFNPLNGENVYTNDASLLLPDNVGGEEYLVMSWPVAADGDPAKGYFTVVATQPGETKVQIWNTQDVSGSDGVPDLSSAAGELPHEFTLVQGQVLSLGAAPTKGADLTGTRIASDKKISVFSGHTCAYVPALPEPIKYCDHIEQQLFPLKAWGDTYVADMFKPRNSKAKDTWRILSGADGVNVTLSPSLAGPFTDLSKGEYVEVNLAGSFEISATGPVLVGHYMQGSNYDGFTNDPDCSDWISGTGIGDPAFTLVVPTKQFLSEYVFLTPGEYRDDYVNIVAEAGTQILVDGSLPTGIFQPIAGQMSMGLLQLAVPDGVHKVTGNKPFGLTVYGYDCDVSYAYPGGLVLK